MHKRAKLKEVRQERSDKKTIVHFWDQFLKMVEEKEPCACFMMSEYHGFLPYIILDDHMIFGQDFLTWFELEYIIPITIECKKYLFPKKENIFLNREESDELRIKSISFYDSVFMEIISHVYKKQEEKGIYNFIFLPSNDKMH